MLIIIHNIYYFHYAFYSLYIQICSLKHLYIHLCIELFCHHFLSSFHKGSVSPLISKQHIQFFSLFLSLFASWFTPCLFYSFLWISYPSRFHKLCRRSINEECHQRARILLYISWGVFWVGNEVPFMPIANFSEMNVLIVFKYHLLI